MRTVRSSVKRESRACPSTARRIAGASSAGVSVRGEEAFETASSNGWPAGFRLGNAVAIENQRSGHLRVDRFVGRLSNMPSAMPVEPAADRSSRLRSSGGFCPALTQVSAWWTACRRRRTRDEPGEPGLWRQICVSADTSARVSRSSTSVRSTARRNAMSSAAGSFAGVSDGDDDAAVRRRRRSTS